jgi:UDP-N-acetylmuramoyl-tripeptide--D-alanyl-D-alanine ligase
VDVIDDTYNANPASMEAGLSMLASGAAGRRAVAVLGDMYELGPEAAGLHEQVGGCVARSGVHLLVAVGKHAERVRAGAVGSGLPPSSVICLESTEAVLEGGELGSALREGDLVLVKGSRGMKMERIVESLIYW